MRVLINFEVFSKDPASRLTVKCNKKTYIKIFLIKLNKGSSMKIVFVKECLIRTPGLLMELPRWKLRDFMEDAINLPLNYDISGERRS